VPQVTISPVDALLDQSVAIEVTNLKPKSRIRLILRNHTLMAEAQAEFIASADGVVNVTEHASVAGD